MKIYSTTKSSPRTGFKKSGFTLLETLIMFGLLFIISMIVAALYIHSQKESEAAERQVIEETAGDTESTSPAEEPQGEPLD